MKLTLKVAQSLTTCMRIFFCFSLPSLLLFLLSMLVKELYYFGGDAVFLQRFAKYPKQIWFWCNFIPALLLFFIGILIHYSIGNKKRISIPIMITVAIILICIDQVIQLLVNIYSGSIHITVVKGWLEIIPKSMLQEEGSYLSNAQKPAPVHLLTCFLGIAVGCFMLRFLFYFMQNRNLIVTAATLYVTGIFCSIIDAIFYGYGYDYIDMYPLYIFDIKDTYILIGFSTLLLSLIQNQDSLKKITVKSVQEYVKWEAACCAAFFNKFSYIKLKRKIK
jgi:signal peptidase II